MHEKVVAIGEIGLDYYYEDNPPRELQIEAFKRQLDLACELDMPVAIHTRDAEEDTYNILKSQKEKYENFSALLHSYPGDVELMEKYLQLGFYISLNGITTFKNGTFAQSVAKAIPLNRLVLETDCPYLSPTPFRGKRNEPKRVRNTAEYIAVLRGISFDKLVENTDRNTLDFYRL
ncbi:MAG: TatD family hydrolase, partial [Tissierellia bacterium]|nr:TatD family hydrolase [Tissierellia bacterium]